MGHESIANAKRVHRIAASTVRFSRQLKDAAAACVSQRLEGAAVKLPANRTCFICQRNDVHVLLPSNAAQEEGLWQG